VSGEIGRGGRGEVEEINGAVEEAEEFEVEAGAGHDGSDKGLDERAGEEGGDGGDVGKGGARELGGVDGEVAGSLVVGDLEDADVDELAELKVSALASSRG
jgi:hypothetical protein